MPTPIRKLNHRRVKWFRVNGSGPAALAACAAGFAGLIAASTLAAAQAETAALDRVTPAGLWLVRAIDRLDVEHHWLRGHEHVAWRSGIELLEEHGKLLAPLAKDETHCSAFAAAVADELGIYLLHPPEHSHVLLANAQFAWLPSDAGQKAGWSAVASAEEAQVRANDGELVVAVFENPNGALAGHIAVVRPSVETAERIEVVGPQITQAGFVNAGSTDLAIGFDHHPGAWDGAGGGSVKFYAHVVTAKGLAGE